MYEYIEGRLAEKNPAYCIIETGGIGYHIQITLSTYSQLENTPNAKLYLHQVVREDAHLLFGFHSKTEREIFRMLLTVSGVGANTARMMLSSLNSEEVQQAIREGNAALLQSIKGIGNKTAQRVILDLRDKISIDKGIGELLPMQDNRLKDEALSALIILGFNKGEAEKTLAKILHTEKGLSPEDLIKRALKLL